MVLKRIGQRVLWRRAKDYVAHYRPLLIGVTGSTGKTMAKDAIALALQDSRYVRATPNNLNTSVGVALSAIGVVPPKSIGGWTRLLAHSLVREVAEPEPDTIVLELGADRPGDIGYVAQQLPFSIGVVTNVASTHLRLFGNKEMVAHEKMSLIVSLPKDGIAILNADDPLVVDMAEHSKARVVWYGTSQGVDVQLVRATRLDRGGFALAIDAFGKNIELVVPHLVARYQLVHLLAALAVAHALEVDVVQAAANFKHFVPAPGRLRQLAGVGGAVLLDDSYNASPEATLAALHILHELSSRRRIAILGDMLDLGAESYTWHKRVGKYAGETAHVFVAVGQLMREAGAEALRLHYGADVHHFDSSRDVGKWLAQYLRVGDLVLIKGSRDMHMEEVVKRLLAHPERDEGKLVG